jgi:hypothetical protein
VRWIRCQTSYGSFVRANLIDRKLMVTRMPVATAALSMSGNVVTRVQVCSTTGVPAGRA